MAFQAKDGKSFTNRPPMMAHNKSMASKGGMEHDPLAQPAGGGDEQQHEMDKGDKPMMTHHHPDGTHTTVHESGEEHNHENLEALKAHLDQFIDEEAHEPSEQGEPEYD